MRKFHPKKFSTPRAFHAVCVDALFACLFVAAAAQLSTFNFRFHIFIFGLLFCYACVFLNKRHINYCPATKSSEKCIQN